MTKEYDILFGVTHFYSGQDFYVAQKEKYGCALACVAMILGMSYEEIKRATIYKFTPINLVFV